jgi:hypothetical protein
MSFLSLMALLSKAKNLAMSAGSAAKSGSFPVSAALSGTKAVGKSLFYTTTGRVIVVLTLLLLTFSYFKHHFTALEKYRWEAAVVDKQAEIVNKVASINAETTASQRAAKLAIGYWDRVLAVVADGIARVQPPHRIEPETVDLINETRGKSSRSSTSGH